MFSYTFGSETVMECFQIVLFIFPFFSCGQCIYNLLYSLHLILDVSLISVWLLSGLFLYKNLAKEANTLFFTSLQKLLFRLVKYILKISTKKKNHSKSYGDDMADILDWVENLEC